MVDVIQKGSSKFLIKGTTKGLYQKPCLLWAQRQCRWWLIRGNQTATLGFRVPHIFLLLLSCLLSSGSFLSSLHTPLFVDRRPGFEQFFEWRDTWPVAGRYFYSLDSLNSLRRRFRDWSIRLFAEFIPLQIIVRRTRAHLYGGWQTCDVNGSLAVRDSHSELR